ncbi:hypothetical protein QR680_019433 [Steinernema hermaphroditum]|uniref:Globin domain-containing protein n=1 Tax=Steinernema hermaphroditum TaxID=289476 RepID=A0AA39GP38_9BILA|nr:hypothetical protein QR680_019433 [Steinernema hermaphroditum]
MYRILCRSQDTNHISTPTIEPPTVKRVEYQNGSTRSTPTCKRNADIAQVVDPTETFTKMEQQAIPNALNILIRLFSDYPNYKNIWPQFRAIPDSALMYAPELRRHAQVYMTGLRTIIDAMDDDAKLTASLKRIAKAHIKWNIHKSHLMHMVEPVVQVVRETNGGLLTDEMKHAWITLYDVIANLIDIYRVIEQAERRR